MKIGINLLFITKHMESGLGKHAEELLQGFSEIGLLSHCTLFVQPSFSQEAKRKFPQANVLKINDSLKATLATGLAKCLPKGVKRVIKGVLRRSRSASQRPGGASALIMEPILRTSKFQRLTKRAAEEHLDVLLHTFNDSRNVLAPGMPNVVVVHDLFYRKHKDVLSPQYYDEVDKGHQDMVKAAALVVISQTIREELLEEFPEVDPRKVTVIHNSVSMERSAAACRPETPYLLCVNAHDVHKNQLTLLKAFSLLADKIPHDLIFLGGIRTQGEAAFAAEAEFVKTKGLQDRVQFLTSVIPVDQRDRLYENASIFVSPSRYEGFGRTPVEAAMLEIPVLASDIPCHREATCGLVAYYGPPGDEKALAEKLAALIEAPPAPQELREISQFLKQRYAKSQIALQYKTLLEKTVEGYREISD